MDFKFPLYDFQIFQKKTIIVKELKLAEDTKIV